MPRRRRARRRRAAGRAGRARWGGGFGECDVSWGGVGSGRTRHGRSIVAKIARGTQTSPDPDDPAGGDCGKVERWRPGSFCCVASTLGEPTGWPWPTSGTWSTALGHTEVSTYIQSGNVVLRSDRKDRAAMAAEICAGIKAKSGLSCRGCPAHTERASSKPGGQSRSQMFPMQHGR